MANGASERTVDLSIARIRPNEQREAGSGTVTSLATFIDAGLGVSIASASVAQVLAPEVRCIPLASTRCTTVEQDYRENSGNPTINRLVEHVSNYQ